MGKPILLAIIVAELLTFLDIPDGVDEDPLRLDILFRLAIGPARVIDVPGDIITAFPVNRPVVLKLKKILPATAVSFFFRNNRAPIFAYQIALADGTSRKQSQSVSSTPDGDMGMHGFLHMR